MKNISISVIDLNKTFGEVSALKSISLELKPGFLHGIIGPDGAGKTTLLRILAGLLHPTAGKVVYFNDGKQTDFGSVRQHIGYMPSRASLYPDLSIDEHLNFFKSLYSIEEKDFIVKTENLMRITRLEQFRGRKVGQLSGGMYKKVGLMCALLQSPKVLLLDEPTNGVDPISRREFWELLYGLIKENILIVVSTAYMDEAERCGKVHVVESGTVISSGDPEEIMKLRKVDNFAEVFK